MSRLETTMTVSTSIAGSLLSHVFCCGLLPLAINVSANAFLSGFGAQAGLAVVTTLSVATGVTLFEKHRHATVCESHGGCSHHGFAFQKHFLRNLAIGICTYSFFAVLTHLPAVHEMLDGIFAITH